MNQSQKWFIGITLFILSPVILGFLGMIFGFRSVVQSYTLILIIALAIHLFLFFLYDRSRLKKWVIYLPSIAMLVVTLFLTYIAIRNARIPCNPEEGCMNEDFSGVFAFITGVLTLISCFYSFLFHHLWYQKTR